MERSERYRGCLLGLAAGDALGTTLEFEPPGSFKPMDDIVGGGPFGLKPGEWTDDTSMALCLAESLIESRAFDPADQMERYVRWYRHGCLVNDIAVGLARLCQEGIRRRVLIIDLDLHQGDGNATVFAGDRETYTVSVHEENIFPIPKARSDLDIGLAAWTGDADYLVAVDEALAHARQHFTPEMIVYVAGSDPYQDDPLGWLQITPAGLLARDRRVVDFARALRCPLMAVPAGGYTDESPSITAATFRAIAEGEHATVARRS